MTVKTRIQGNALVITLPKSLDIKVGAQFEPTKNEDGSIVLTPVASSKTPDSIEELFKEWNGNYSFEEIEEWHKEPKGDELW